MNFNASMLKLMADKGLSAHDIAEIAAASETRSSGAARQARYRARKRDGDVTSDVTALRDPAPNERDILTPTRKEKPKAKALCKKFVLPADIPAEPWDAWLESRKSIRKSPTDHAKQLAVTELRRLRDEEGWPPGTVLNHCTMNSYQGIFPPKRGFSNERPDPLLSALQSFTATVGTGAGTGEDHEAGGSGFDEPRSAPVVARIGGGRT